MFTDLMESRPQRDRSKGGAAASIVVHTCVTLLLVVATTGGTPPPRVGEREVRLPMPAPSPASVVEHHSTVTTNSNRTDASPPRPILVPPTINPVGIPPIDVTAKVVDPDEFRRAGTPTPGSANSPLSGSPGDTYSQEYVERMAVPSASNAPPRYPEMLRASALEGHVDLLFVVDTLGRVEPASIEPLNSTNDLFTSAAREALLRWHFSPAEVRSRKVRVRMQQPFVFTITR